MKKKVVIIGAGIAGLNAGIELLQQGFDVSLYEKNDEVGGLCSGYFVDGYNIDACLHWLMGTKKDTILNDLWRNIDALNDDVEISNLPYFATFIYKGETITFSRNLEEERERWLSISPKDEKNINSFFDCVTNLAYVWNLSQGKGHKKLGMDILKTLSNSAKLYKTMQQSREDYANKFSHPALRFALRNAMTGYNNAFFFLLVYGLFSTGDGNVPVGGAYYMVQRIKNKFLSLGGDLHLNTEIDSLEVQEKRIVSAYSKGKRFQGDYYISALDPYHTFKHLLGNKFRPKMYTNLKKMMKSHPISSCFCLYIKVDSYQNNINVPTGIKIKKLNIGTKVIDNLLIRPYSFDTTFNYNGSAVISLFVDQDQDDYLYFKTLKDYEIEKNRIIKSMIESFLYRYPEYKDKVTLLSAFGPLELHNKTNTTFGALQAFSFSKATEFYNFKGEIKNIKNFYMCGQWNRSIGGTPTALLTSHDIVQRLIKNDIGLKIKALNVFSKHI